MKTKRTSRRRRFSSGLLPRKMKQIEFTVLTRDIDNVIEYLGREAVMQFVEESEARFAPNAEGDPAVEEKAPRIEKTDAVSRANYINEQLDKLETAAAYLGLAVPVEPEEKSRVPGENEDLLAKKLCDAVLSLSKKENEQTQEKQKIEEALFEARAFANLNAPYADLDQLSYLTLRVGHIDSRKQAELRESLTGRAVIVSLDGESGGDRILAATSRKGRFALDTELKQADFSPISIPEGYKGVPAELLQSLEEKLEKVKNELTETGKSKKDLKDKYGENLLSLCASYLMAEIMEELKDKLVSTNIAFFLAGWVPADSVPWLVEELASLTEGRIAVRSFNPDEIPAVREGTEKVPVSLKHGAFVKGFEGLVFSYAAPLYGTIDPTPFVAVFFTLLFGIMFGDLGQGFVLLLLGILTGKHGPKFLSGFRGYSIPLRAAGIASMVMGFLTGEVFANETLLIAPTLALTDFLTGNPVERILILMPLAEHGGSVTKLFYFFGFTLCIGVILNSAGLVINFINQISLRNYKNAFFAKTGLAGTLFFWYALSIAVRFILSSMGGGEFGFKWFDIVGLALPVALITFAPVLGRLFSGKRPVFHEGLLVFIIEGAVEVLETFSTYFSNTASFLRVGAFALSHAVLSFVVFFFAEQVSNVPAGPFFSFIVVIIGNSIIILLEGLIVAIQVVRLQYYEFFSKFFTETGVEFAPFRFRKGANL